MQLFSFALGSAAYETRMRQRALHSLIGSMVRNFSGQINARCMSNETFYIAGQTNTALYGVWIDSLLYPDTDYVRRWCSGFEVVGDDGSLITDSHVYRAIEPTKLPPRARRRLFTHFLGSARTAAVATMRRTASRALASTGVSRTAFEAIMEKTRAELDLGLIIGPLSLRDFFRRFSPYVRLLNCFAIWQSGKWRRIDDGSESGTNDMSFLQETITTPGFDYPLFVARRLSELAKQANVAMPRMTYALADLSAAFRTIPTRRPGYTGFAVYNFTSDRVEIYYCPGHNFGLRAVVVSFNLLPELVVSVARSFGAVPANHFFDDIMMPDVRAARDSGLRLIEGLHADLGDPAPISGRVRAPALAPDKTLEPASENVGLGVSVDLSAVRKHSAVYFSPKPGRLDNIRSIFEQCFLDSRMSPTVAATLVGKLGFVCRTTYGRVGRAALLPLIHRQHRDIPPFHITDAIRASYDFYMALFAVLPPIAVPLQPNPLPPITLFTDASFSLIKRKRGECSTSTQHIL